MNQEPGNDSRSAAKAREPFILFEVAGNSYGINSRYVRQIEMIENITPVPNTEAFIDGVMYSRGNAIPVVNLRTLFGLEKIEYNLKTRVIVIMHNNRTIGLIADSAKEYTHLDTEKIQPPPDFMKGTSSDWLEGIYRIEQRIILIFNADALVRSAEEKVTN